MVTIQYLPYLEHGSLDSEEKIKKLLKLVKEDKILMMEGRLSPVEEAKLIERTMEEISKNFKGVEICTIYPNGNGNKKKQEFWSKVKLGFFNMVLGSRQGVTIIGPASLIKEIKRDPNKIELLMKNKRKR
ncbi:MAG: DUF2073 domain-containing protein [Nanoarchaeota archaeon]|nr:DUF2073 domain-containing protein [Nanoarchaeota archaeon]MBU1445400.1 DUF2073 domain-containing protein [Nanoarchaeota archaeon]MBU2406536.1 DUF2073 domain-containing protein [Nanoarchaeota archaeon]MBU2420173.1 DUF2073 domain-containing protein [Nanoarchaeota archaeon]MBU2475252.1 DUF2073 domain-containing protein [Nanoarchaeota archaeon]